MPRTTPVNCAHWVIDLPADETAPELEPATPPKGQQVLKLTVHPTDTLTVAERGHYPVVPGQAYCLAAAVRTALGNAHGRLFLQWLDAAGAVLGEDASKYTFLVHDYAPLHVWAVAPAGTVAARCLLRLTPPAPGLYPPSGALWLAPSSFAPSLLLDATPRANAALFDAGHPVHYLLAIRRAPATLRQATVRHTLTDLNGTAVADGSITIPLHHGEGRATLALPALPSGYYELALTVAGDDLAPFELRRSLGCLPAGVVHRRPDSPIALDAGLAWPADNDFRPERTAAQAAACARLGLSLLRERLAWYQVNPEPGCFDWGKYRQSAEIQRAHGLDVYSVFHDTPAWARVAADDDSGNYPPADPRHVYEFTRRLALDLGGAIRYFELWNEPDIFFSAGHPWDVAAIIKAGCLGLKDADPSTGVLASSRAIGPAFWRSLLANGIGPYFEIWNQHCYGQPEDLFELMRENRELLAEAGLERPVWMTEMGQRSAPMADGSYTIPERLQISYLVRAYACGLAAGFERFFYFYLQEFLEYGVHLWGLQRSETLDPKPAFIALANLIRQLGRARPVGMLKEERRYCIVFETEAGEHTAVAWSLDGNPLAEARWNEGVPEPPPRKPWAEADGVFDLPVKPGARLIDAVGRELVAFSGDRATVRLAIIPVFVSGLDIDGMVFEPLPEPVRFAPATAAFPDERRVWLQAITRPGRPLNQEFQQTHKLALPVEPGQTEPLELRVHNWSGRAQGGGLTFDLPEGWSCDTATPIPVSVNPDNCATVRLDLMPGRPHNAPPPIDTPAIVSVRITLYINGHPHDVARVEYSMTNGD